MYRWGLKTYNYTPYVQYSDVFSSNQIDLINEIGLNNLNASPLEKSQVVSDFNYQVDDNIRRSFISWIYSDVVHNNWLYQMLSAKIEDVNRHFFNFDLNEIETLQYTEYDSSYEGVFKKHVDILSPHTYMRKITFSIQLSKPDEYEGGDFILHTGQEPVVLDKTRGSIAFFPSWTLHEVTPITKGTRRSLVGWVIGPRFK